ncbi:MAG TPA: hypothetical protein VKR32_11175 [Puia sp.]|nr:hypothetical protein [Puia sp.]
MQTAAISNYLGGAGIITVLCLLIYAAVQQEYRRGANDPQVMLASEIKDRLEHAQPIDELFPKDTIDLSRSTEVFVTLYDSRQNPLRTSGFLDGKYPEFPAGVLESVSREGEDRISWQPRGGVRMAMVILRVRHPSIVYVAVGRSLREVETREGDLLFMVFVGWIACMGLLAILVSIQIISKRIAYD